MRNNIIRYVFTTKQQGWERPYHVVARKKFLQELGLFVQNCFDDKLVIAGHVEDGAAGSWIGQLDQGLIAQGVLAKTQPEQRSTLNPTELNPICLQNLWFIINYLLLLLSRTSPPTSVKNICAIPT